MEKGRVCLLLTFLYGSFLIGRCSAGPLLREFVYPYPNFTASYSLYMDNSGAFLASANSTFRASVCNPGKQQSLFYLCVTHYPSGVLIWSANRNRPISSSDAVTLTSAGLSISGPGGASPVWSTPKLPRAVAALRLLETGNLVLLDASNTTLWQSFDHPTDVLVAGQRLPVGGILTSSVSDSNLSEGNYRLEVTARDVVLRWRGDQQYWSMWSDLRFFPNSNAPATYLEVNATGVYLLSSGGYIFAAPLPPTARLRIAKLESTKGQLVIKELNPQGSGAGGDGNSTFVTPETNCELPVPCSSLGLCTPGIDAGSSSCGCPSGFTSGSNDGGCVPNDGSALPSPSSLCTSTPSGAGDSPSTSAASTVVSYAPLGNKIGYFANRFASPAMTGIDFAACRSSCSANCTCLGFYYRNASKSCYLLENELGSLFALPQDSPDSPSASGYIKINVARPSSKRDSKSLSGSMALPIVLPSVALFLLVVVLLLLWRRRRQPRPTSQTWTKESPTTAGDWWKKSWPTDQQVRNGGGDDGDEEEEEEGSYYFILGLPTSFKYEELEAVTEGFRERIGSGGFGDVYKGVLPDGSAVAVKRITSMGVQGKKEFCTEIAVIGNIHHVNLVKLRGFCAQGSRRLLVYEYMNRGSLDRSLFAAPGRPVLEWQERVDIAIGAAKGLAYLHAGCDQKIIHCDVKPENILLHDHNGVKISDFGLAKLLSPDQSSLMTTMRGTRGYLAPEWLGNTAISDRTDVYSFGMVLLEIVRGRKNCAVATASSSPLAVETLRSGSMSGQNANGDEDEERSLTNSTVVRPSATYAASSSALESYFPLAAMEKHEEGRYEELVDPRLEGRVSREEVARVVKVALCCLHEDPGRRPPMSMVAGMLDGTVTVLEPRIDLLRFLRFYGRTTAEPPSTTGGNASVARSTSSSNSDKVAHHSYLSSLQVSGPR